jgi:hypothetical protein
MSKVGLIKGVTTFSEDLSFAKRAYLRVLELCTIVTPSSSFTASEIIVSGKTDAIGINVLFVAILRSSNIPARLLHRYLTFDRHSNFSEKIHLAQPSPTEK